MFLLVIKKENEENIYLEKNIVIEIQKKTGSQRKVFIKFVYFMKLKKKILEIEIQ